MIFHLGVFSVIDRNVAPSADLISIIASQALDWEKPQPRNQPSVENPRTREKLMEASQSQNALCDI